MPDLVAALAELASASAVFSDAVRSCAGTVSDDLLVESQRQLASTNRLIETGAAGLAAEVAFRSRRELGYQGLAQRRGARTPEALVQQLTGSSGAAARRLVRVGTMAAELQASRLEDASPMTEPWLAPALAAMARGELSAEAVEVIRAGLGQPTAGVQVDALADATGALATQAREVTLERLAALARERRDDLDLAGVALREEERRQRRFLRLTPQLDGMTRIVGLLDPESAAIVTTAIDAATSPRRGGPRFVRKEDVDRAEAIINDERTTEQIALDSLVEMVEVAMRSRGTKIGVGRPAVRVLVTLRDLENRRGVGFIDGQNATVSIATIERHACEGGYIPILFDDNGQGLNLGRTQRLHNGRQREVLATRDGGCLCCDRPASWTEVHHIEPFQYGGRTDLATGELLCRHHHMLIHNNGWQIKLRDGTYWLIPPPGVDPEMRPIRLEAKSAARRRLLATT
jgi:hypothetical protein